MTAWSIVMAGALFAGLAWHALRSILQRRVVSLALQPTIDRSPEEDAIFAAPALIESSPEPVMSTTPVVPRAQRITLGAIDGFDIDAGLRHVGGKPAVMERVLLRFIESHGGGDIVFDASHLDAKRRMEACHSLRGACAAIGATRVASLATELEDRLRCGLCGAAVEEAAQHLRVELERLVDLLGIAIAGARSQIGSLDLEVSAA